MFNYTFFGRCSEFFIGISLALIYKYDLPFLKKFKYYTYTGILGIIISLILLTILQGNFDFGIRHPLGKIVNTLFLPLFGISMLYYGLLKEETLISKILSLKLFVLLGKSSYIFYLIHMGIFVNELNILSITNPFMYLSNLILLNLVSIVMFRYIEEPFNIFIRRYNTSRQLAFSKKESSVIN